MGRAARGVRNACVKVLPHYGRCFEGVGLAERNPTFRGGIRGMRRARFNRIECGFDASRAGWAGALSGYAALTRPTFCAG